MNTLIRTIALIIVGGVAVAGLRAATPTHGKAADNKIQAQALVVKLMADNPELFTAGMHAVAPSSHVQTIIASTLNVIGKPSDPPELGVVADGETILSPNLKVPKLGVMMPLHDRSGKRIGALALAFRFPAGKDEVACLAKSIAIRDRLAQEIPSLDTLFTATP
jgi:hypothetical protein